MCVCPNAAVFSRPLKTYALDPSMVKWKTHFFKGAFEDEDSKYLEAEVFNLQKQGYEAKWSMLPCGQCWQCRLSHSREWANRCVMEIMHQPKNTCWFVTLTYADDHVKHLQSFIDSRFLSLHQVAPGEKDDLQDFMHNIRQIFKRKYDFSGIRFLACGEYGDKSLRPHYHVLLFNAPFSEDDLDYKFSNHFGHLYYTSDLLDRAWGKGIVVVSPANWTNAAYTARYVMKKQTGENAVDAYESIGIRPPFIRASNAPGIGGAAYDGFNTFFVLDEDTGELKIRSGIVLQSDGKTPNSCDIPRYFKRLYSLEDIDKLEYYKAERQKAYDIVRKTEKSLNGLSDRELFQCRTDEYNNHSIGLMRLLE